MSQESFKSFQIKFEKAICDHQWPVFRGFFLVFAFHDITIDAHRVKGQGGKWFWVDGKIKTF